MSRNFALFVAVATVAGWIPLGLSGRGSVANGQTPVVQDTFDDNKQGTLWSVFGKTSTAGVTEVNKHLEFSTSTSASFVGYISNKWWIDPNQDFQMRVDLHFADTASGSGWIVFGLTPDEGTPLDHHIVLGIGRSTGFENYWWQLKDGFQTTTDFTSRVKPTVTLYISYDWMTDTLYLGDAGYGANMAWKVLSKFTKSKWGDVHMYPFLGVMTENLAISAGTVYADNFAIDKGRIGSPYQSPDDGSSDDGPVITDVEATVKIFPSVIGRKSLGDRVTALVGLPPDVTMAYWDPTDVPVLSPGAIEAAVQGAFVWADGTVKILASFSKTALLQAIKTDGDVRLYLSGKLKDGRTYAGDCVVLIQ